MSENKTNEHKTPNSGAGKGFLMMIPFILIGIIIIKYLFSFSEPENKSNNVDNSNKTTVTQYNKTIQVNYSSEYGNPINLPLGFDYYFNGATEDYCCSNKNGEEYCGNKGEDLNMGDSPANSALRFKSQNGNTGKLTIVLIKK